MPRDFKIYLDDIRQAIAKIRDYVKGQTRQSFAQDQMRIDAVVRNLEIIGEAAKMIPEPIRSEYPTIEWKKILGCAISSPITISKSISILFGT